MNRHRYNDMQEVWDSFEWLYREKLEYLDNLTRTMFKDMQATGASLVQIREFVPQRFAELWVSVAEDNDERVKPG